MHNFYRATRCSKRGQLADGRYYKDSQPCQSIASVTDHNLLYMDFEDRFWNHDYAHHFYEQISPVFQPSNVATSEYGKRDKQQHSKSRNGADCKIQQSGSTTMHTSDRGRSGKNRGNIRNKFHVRGGSKLGFKNWKANSSTSKAAILKETTTLGHGTKSTSPGKNMSSSLSSQGKSTKPPCLRPSPVSSFSAQSQCIRSPYLRTNPTSFSKVSSFSKGESKVAGSSMNPPPTTEDNNEKASNCSTDTWSRGYGIVAAGVKMRDSVRNGIQESAMKAKSDESRCAEIHVSLEDSGDTECHSFDKANNVEENITLTSLTKTTPSLSEKLNQGVGESDETGSACAPRDEHVMALGNAKVGFTVACRDSQIEVMDSNGSTCKISKSKLPTDFDSNEVQESTSPIAVGVTNQRMTHSIPRAEVLKERATLGHGTKTSSLLKSAFSTPESEQIGLARLCKGTDIQSMGSNGNNNDMACAITTFPDEVVANATNLAAGMVSECPDAGESNSQGKEFIKIAIEENAVRLRRVPHPRIEEGFQNCSFGERSGETLKDVSFSPAPLPAVASTNSSVSAKRKLPKWHHVGTKPLVMNMSFEDGHFDAVCGGEDKTAEHLANNQFSINVVVPTQSALNGNLQCQKCLLQKNTLPQHSEHSTANLVRITVDDRERSRYFQPSSTKKTEKLSDKLRQIEKKYTEESEMLSGVFCFISRKLPDQEGKLAQCLAEMLEVLGNEVYSSCFQLLENGFSEEHEISDIKDYSSMPFSVLISQIIKKEDAKLMSVNPNPPQVHRTMGAPGE